MGLIRSLFGRAASWSSSGIATPEKWVEEWFAGGSATAAGVWVGEETALHYAPFFAGVRVIAEDVASLPLITYERLVRGKRRATEHPLYRLLHDQPNPYMTSVTFRETLQGHVLTWGNGYAYIARNGAGDVTELWPLRPDRMCPELTRTGPGKFTLWYRYEDPVNNIRAMLHPSEVLHVAGLGGDGVCGYSVIGLARQSIGLGVAAERYGARLFSNGSRPAGVLRHPGRLSDEARKRMAADWEAAHRGLSNSHRVAILEEGVEWQTIGIPPEDAQFLETRRFQVTEMARWLRLPPHKIGDLDRATFSNIEHQALDYVTSALRIWLVRWEQAISARLLTETEQPRYFAEHLVDGLLRGDIKSRYEAYAIARNWGWLSADDVRELENLNPLPDGRGDVYLIPLNMQVAPTPQQIEDAQAASAPEPPPVSESEPEDAAEDGDEDEAGDSDGDGEPRALPRRRDIGERRRIAERYAALLAEADAELAEWERQRIAELAERYLGEPLSTTAFVASIEELYGEDGEAARRTYDAWHPILVEFAEAVAADAAADVAYSQPVDLSAWVHTYAATHVAYRVASQLGQLAAAASKDDPAAAVLERAGEWVAERPERFARWQSVQLSSAAAREVWRAAGVRSLTWVTFGSGDCPFCGPLDGRTVGIDEPFAAAGAELGGLAEKLQVARDTHHPPLHPGCDCQIRPA